MTKDPLLISYDAYGVATVLQSHYVCLLIHCEENPGAHCKQENLHTGTPSYVAEAACTTIHRKHIQFPRKCLCKISWEESYMRGCPLETTADSRRETTLTSAQRNIHSTENFFSISLY